MKLTWILLLVFSLSTYSWAQKSQKQQQQQQPATTLLEDLEEFYHLIITAPLKQLVRRYLLHDEQFQAFVRTINSQDAYFLLQQVRAQPEVLAFTTWTRTQNMANGEVFELPVEESAQILNIFDPAPGWITNVYGWQGFMREFEVYYQQSLVNAHIAAKLQQNGAFAQYWQRIVALQPVYERVLGLPQSQQLLQQLQTIGVDTYYLDQFIRKQFNWFAVNATTPIYTSTTVAP